MLTRRGDYVVRAALCLARAWEEGGRRKIREVSAAMDLPRGYTPTILRMLAKAGLATAKAGTGGGYRLARAPHEITLLEVVETGEGPLAPTRCTLRGGPCHWEQACAVHPNWAALADAVRASLAGTTLADLVRVDQELTLGTFVPDSPHAQPRARGGRRRGEGRAGSGTRSGARRPTP